MTAAPRALRRSVTVEHALYGAVFAVGIAVRFGGLGARPLNSLEAWNAWSSWQAASGLPGPSELTPTSPLWHSLQTFLFWLGADGDAWARSVSAAAGAGLVLAPWMLRGLMGRPAALILGALFALDPWLIAFSRLADSAMISATLAILVLGSAVLLLERHGCGQEVPPNAVHAQEPPGRAQRHHASQRRLANLLAVGAGLFVVSGHMAWGFAPVLLAFGVLNWGQERGSPEGPTGLPRGLSRSGRRGLSPIHPATLGREAALWFAVGAIAGATAGLTKLDGLGLVSASLTMWLDSALTTGAPVPASTMLGDYALGWPLTRLLVDQPLLAVFGIGGLVYLQVGTPFRRGPEGSPPDAFAHRIHWRLTLWLWLAWGVLLCLLPGRSPFSLLVLVMPLLIGAAYALDGLRAGAKMFAAQVGGSPPGPAGPGWGQESLALFFTLAVLGISAAFWGIALVSDAVFSAGAGQAVVVIVGLAIALIVLYGAWSRPRQALWIAATAFSVILALASVSSAWQLNHRTGPGRRDSLFRETGAPDMRRLADDIATLSAHRAGGPLDIPIFVQSARYAAPSELPSPATLPVYRTLGSREDVVVGWTLRNMKRVTWGGLPQERDRFKTAPLLLQAYLGDALSAPAPAQEYIGSDYVVRTAWLPDTLGERGSPASASKDAGVDVDTEGQGGSVVARLNRLWPATIQPRLRWAFYRRATTPPQDERIILWVERDGAGGGFPRALPGDGQE